MVLNAITKTMTSKTNKYFAEMYQNMLAVRKEFTEEVLEMYNERKSKESGSKRVRN